jgi:hypothetical protein
MLSKFLEKLNLYHGRKNVQFIKRYKCMLWIQIYMIFFACQFPHTFLSSPKATLATFLSTYKSCIPLMKVFFPETRHVHYKFDVYIFIEWALHGTYLQPVYLFRFIYMSLFVYIRNVTPCKDIKNAVLTSDILNWLITLLLYL